MDVHSHVDSKGVPLQDKLHRIMNKKGGFFIELGANDGHFQSNTAFFEKEMGWRGILIEPSVEGYEMCKQNRPNSICLNYACVSCDYREDYVKGDFKYNDPMASVNGVRCNYDPTEFVSVKAITMEKILDEHCDTNIDFLSLDTEGYELNILKGMNLKKYRPNSMLIEIYEEDYESIVDYLKENRYTLHSNLSNYNCTDNPDWDGSHNDYLFTDNTIPLFSTLES